MEDLKPRFGRKFATVSNWYGVGLIVKCVLPVLFVIVWLSNADINSVGMWTCSVVLLGWSGYRIQFVLHEATHNTLFSHRGFNDVVASASGLIVGVNFRKYRYTHLLHHRKNGKIDDPQYPDYLPQAGLTRVEYVRFIVGPIFGSRVRKYLKRELFTNDLTAGNDQTPRVSFGWFILVGAVQLVICFSISDGFSNWWMIPTHIIGLSTISLLLSRLRTIAEHQQIGGNQVDFTRSHKKRFLEVLFLYDANFNLHTEHHLYPGVQSRILPEVRRELEKSNPNLAPLGSSMIGTIRNLYRIIGAV